MRNPEVQISFDSWPGIGDSAELVVDNFAGGGGASTGIGAAIGRDPDIAINHDPVALAMHQRNHPATHHYCESIFDVDPREACAGRPVGLAWFSPDCTHFSRAKGGQPRKKEIRCLAWVVVRWAAAVRPRVIILENVAEFATWGPLTRAGQPIRERQGETFAQWLEHLRRLGYNVEWRQLVAADYGAPTTRKRLFLIARCDGEPIEWPRRTHGEGARHPWRTAAECIDWSIQCPSIFERKRPLAQNTLRRIAAGLKRYVVDAAEPFLVPIDNKSSGAVAHGLHEPVRTITMENRFALVAPYVVKPNHQGDRFRGQSLKDPLATVLASSRGHHALVAPTLIQVGYGERDGQAPRVPGLDKPLGTVVAGGSKHALVSAFLIKYYGCGTGQQMLEPLHTITTRDRLGLVTVHGADYKLVDIGLRMLQPRELARAQGFPDSYILDGTKTQQVAMIGNSVAPPCAEALVRANYVAQRVSEEAVA